MHHKVPAMAVKSVCGKYGMLLYIVVAFVIAFYVHTIHVYLISYQSVLPLKCAHRALQDRKIPLRAVRASFFFTHYYYYCYFPCLFSLATGASSFSLCQWYLKCFVQHAVLIGLFYPHFFVQFNDPCMILVIWRLCFMIVWWCKWCAQIVMIFIFRRHEMFVLTHFLSQGFGAVKNFNVASVLAECSSLSQLALYVSKRY